MLAVVLTPSIPSVVGLPDIKDLNYLQAILLVEAPLVVTTSLALPYFKQYMVFKNCHFAHIFEFN